jgi:hypothetical protein
MFGYGAGLTAYLTAAVVEKPARVLDMIRKAPAGLRHALAATSEKNSRQADGFPTHLRRRELMGMLAGPWAYLRSRAAVRRHDGEAGR